MKKIILFLLLTIMLFSGCNITDKAYSESKFLLNTYCDITLYGNDSAFLDNAFNELSRLDTLFTYNEGGEIYKLNNGLNCSDEALKVAEIAEKYRCISSGKYNPYVLDITDIYRTENIPDSKQAKELTEFAAETHFINGAILGNGKLDVGSVAKGYISQQIKDYLENSGVERGIINLGGNITLIGDKFGEDYTVALKKPFSDGNIAYLKLKDTTISTCGTYERYFEKNGINYHHIIDATTGYPIENELNSVTVIWNNAAEADALSTFLFTEGLSSGMEYVESHNGIEAVFITKDNEIILSGGLKQTDNIIELTERT